MDFINVTLGSLDNPQKIAPEAQSNLAEKMKWFSLLDALPVEAEKPVNDMTASNNQHPDHDTSDWPLQEKRHD